MKISRNDVDKIFSAYERENLLFSRNLTKEDYKTWMEIRNFYQNIPLNTDVLDKVRIYQFCKILLNCQYPLSAVTQFCNSLGPQFQCLELLAQNDLYNWHYFEMVQTSKLDLAKLRACFGNITFRMLRNLLAKANILTAEILDWLMELDQEKLSKLYNILETLNNKQALHEKFFPLFFYFDESNEEWSCSLELEYHFNVSEYEKIFEAFVDKIKTPTLKRAFEDFKEILKIPYPGGIQSHFISLIRCKLLTVERLNTFIRHLTLPNEIASVDAHLEALNEAARHTDHYEEFLSIVNEHFELLLKFLRIEGDHPLLVRYDIAYRNVDMIREHSVEFKELYLPTLAHHPNPDSLYRGIVNLYTGSLLSAKTFSAICGENPEEKVSVIVTLSASRVLTENQSPVVLTGNQLSVVPTNNQPRVELTDKQLFVIQNHPDPEYLLSIISSMEKPAIDEHFNKMAADIEEIIMKAKALPEFKRNKASYFFLLPPELLPFLAVSCENGTIIPDHALQIYKKHVIQPIEHANAITIEQKLQFS